MARKTLSTGHRPLATSALTQVKQYWPARAGPETARDTPLDCVTSVVNDMVLQVEIGGRVHQVSVERLGFPDRFRFMIDGRVLEVSAGRVDQGTWSLLLPDGSQHLVSVSGNAASGLTVHLPIGDLPVTLPDARRQTRRHSARTGVNGASGPARIVAPMPGKVVRILAAVGQQVQPGQGVVVVEAMKMENEVRAPRGGMVTEVSVQEGASVEAGALLAVVE